MIRKLLLLTLVCSHAFAEELETSNHKKRGISGDGWIGISNPSSIYGYGQPWSGDTNPWKGLKIATDTPHHDTGGWQYGDSARSISHWPSKTETHHVKTVPVVVTKHVIVEKPVVVERPIHVPVEKVITVPIEKIIHKPVPIAVPYPQAVPVTIEHTVPIPIKDPVAVPIHQPFPVPIKHPVPFPVAVPVPLPVHHGQHHPGLFLGHGQGHGSYGLPYGPVPYQGYGGHGYGVHGYGGHGYGAQGYGAHGYGAQGYGAHGYGAQGYGAHGYGAQGYGGHGFGAYDHSQGYPGLYGSEHENGYGHPYGQGGYYGGPEHYHSSRSADYKTKRSKSSRNTVDRDENRE